MISNAVIYVLSILLLSVSIAWSLECVQCTQQKVEVDTSASGVTPCQNRTTGANSCKNEEICFMIYHKNNSIERGCSNADICKDKEDGTCGTCTSTGCIPTSFKSSGYRENAIPAALLAGTIFLIMGR